MATDTTARRILQIDLRWPWVAGFLAWLVPGAGHLYQRRYFKAGLFFLCIYGLFFAGIALGSYRVVYYRWDAEEWPFPYFAQLGAGVVSLPGYLAIADLNTWKEAQDQIHRERGRNMEIARILTMVAGLLNLLAIGDAGGGPAHRDEEEEWLRQRAEGPAPAEEPAV